MTMNIEDKKIAAFLLLGNSGTDIAKMLVPHMPAEIYDDLLRQATEYEQEQGEELDKDYDLFSKDDTESVWS